MPSIINQRLKLRKDSWLDIRFDVTGIDETEIDAVLTSLLRNDAFIR